jgi:hypothetical protein
VIPDRCLALPPGVLDRPDLSTIAKLVATALNDRFARFDPCTWVGNRRLAQAIGRSIGHARRGLAELIHRGLVGREETDQTPTGRRLWLLWRDQATALLTGAQPPCPPARTHRSEALTVEQFRDVTRIETTEIGKIAQEAAGAILSTSAAFKVHRLPVSPSWPILLPRSQCPRSRRRSGH